MLEAAAPPPPAAAAPPPPPPGPAQEYTPYGAPKAPGFSNPTNPWDTGYSGSLDAEVARREGYNPGKVDWWNYDVGKPRDTGAGLGEGGLYAGFGGGGGGGGGGGAGNFGPLLDQLKADFAAQKVSDLAGRDAGVRRGIIDFGEAPDFSQALGTLGFDPRQVIDPATLSLAEQNTTAGLSAKARIEKANKDTLRQIKNSLAARGLLRSGELGHQLGEQDLRHNQAQFDARRTLLDYLAGVQKAYADSERQRQMAWWQAMMAAAGQGGRGGSGAGTTRPPEPAPPENIEATELGTPDVRGFFRRKPQGGGQIL
jgi:hypothetical protein